MRPCTEQAAWLPLQEASQGADGPGFCGARSSPRFRGLAACRRGGTGQGSTLAGSLESAARAQARITPPSTSNAAWLVREHPGASPSVASLASPLPPAKALARRCITLFLAQSGEECRGISSPPLNRSITLKRLDYRSRRDRRSLIYRPWRGISSNALAV